MAVFSSNGMLLSIEVEARHLPPRQRCHWRWCYHSSNVSTV